MKTQCSDLLYSIDECATGTDKLERVKHDLYKALDFFQLLMQPEPLAVPYMTQYDLGSILKVIDDLGIFLLNSVLHYMSLVYWQKKRTVLRVFP